MFARLKYLWYRFRYTHPLMPPCRPVHLHLEINRSCNCACPACYRQNQDWKDAFPDLQMTKEMINDILCQAKKAGFMSVKFNWRGEPSIADGLSFALSRARQLGFVDVMINSNGLVFISANNLRHITHLAFSVDSALPNLYRVIRYPGRLENACYNIAHMLKNLRHAKVVIQRMTHPWNTENFGSWKKELIILLRRHNKSAVNAMLASGKLVFREYEKEDRSSSVNKKPDAGNYYDCRVPDNSLTIGADGQAWMCPYAYYEQLSLYLGDLRTEKLKDIIRRLKSSDWRSLAAPTCAKCKKQCGGN